MSKLPTVAIVGRTNVGKSTLFNALCGKKKSIVQDEPGVSRDRHMQLVSFESHSFQLIDTGGICGEDEADLLHRAVRNQAEIAIAQADLILAVVDGQSGLHPLDYEVAEVLRRAAKKVIWVVNKCEKKEAELNTPEFYQLGISEFLPVSAAHRQGMHELKASIKTFLRNAPKVEATPDMPGIRVAIVGKPNVGKSTLINTLLGEERLVASPIPGTTRDSIDVALRSEGQQFVLVDTAGLRKRARVDLDTVERFGNIRTLRALADCDVAVLVLDAAEGIPTDQDLQIAELIHKRGRGFIIAVNKWDLLEKDHRTVKNFEIAVRSVFKFAPYAPIVFVSAKTGRRLPNVLRKAVEVHQTRQERIRTAELNVILRRAFEAKPPPVYHGEPIKFFFGTQAETSPPGVVLFVNHPRSVGAAYERYLKAAVRKEFPFEGTEIRFYFKKRTSKGDKADDGSAHA